MSEVPKRFDGNPVQENGHFMCSSPFKENDYVRRIFVGRTFGLDEGSAIRPFRERISEGVLTELRRRINATKWPERETVTDASQGVQLATI